MRSRASGGTCGDSSAAASAPTMSSLRRRAIWVQRAMSTERSSIGGRASARTTAGASVGSASSRSHASRSRISGRWKNAASPISRWATARSSSATESAWPSTVISGTSTAIRDGATPSRAISRSISTATAWACERSLAHRHSSTCADVPPSSAGAAWAVSGPSRAARAARHTAGGQRRLSASVTTCASDVAKLAIRSAPAPR